MDPATIIDPDTKAPIQPDASTTVPEPEPQPEPEPAAAEPPPPAATPAPPEAQTESPQRPLPTGCTDLDAEMLLIAGATVEGQYRPKRRGGAAER